MSDNIVLHGLDDRLDKILEDTYYQLIYQEQVTAIAVQLAGWSEGEADSIRKTIGRKIQKELDALIPRLVSDFISHGMKEESAKTLASAIQACGSYSFNKAHSYEYGLIAYQTAYLKANYPVEYMCSLLNANMDNTDDVIKYIEECKKMGIKVLPPSVKSANLKFIPENGAIRFGLSCIKGINNINIIQADDINTFFMYNCYNKRINEALIKSGALDCFGLERGKLFNLAFDIDNEIKLEEAKINKCYDKIHEKSYELSCSKEGTKKVATLKNQIENQKKAMQKSRDKIKELQHCYDDFNEEQGEIEVLGFTFKDKFSQYAVEKYRVFNPDMYINQYILADIIEVRLHKDKRGRKMAFINAIPYMGTKTDFVVFASSFRDEYASLKGVYVLEVSKGNQVTGIVKPEIK